MNARVHLHADTHINPYPDPDSIDISDTDLKGRRKVAVEASLKSTCQFAAVVTQYRHLVDKPLEHCAHRRILQTLNYHTTLLLGLLCMLYALDPPKPYSRRHLGVPNANEKARSVHKRQ